ncbi:MAG: Mth938-like domain-containing protein [Planctomycetes bacterium]|nr:Mth938-like domain-containing protein [Planctomycetota bacterium]
MTRINSYSFGAIVIDGKEYTSDVIIYPDRVDASWWRKTGHSVCLDDLREILGAQPEIIILGTGASELMQVPDELKEELLSRGLTLLCYKTPWAVEEFNRISANHRVVAGLHLTC